MNKDKTGRPLRGDADLDDFTSGFGGLRDFERVQYEAEERLRISLEKYKVLFESFPLGLIIVDEDGGIIESNPLSVELLGLDLESQRTRTVTDPTWKVLGPEGEPLDPSLFPVVRAMAENRIVSMDDLGVVRSDGSVVWLDVTAAPIPLPGYGAAIAMADVSDRKVAQQALRESEDRFRALFHTNPETIVMTDVDGTILQINRFESDPGHYLGKRLEEFAVDEDSRQAVRDALATARESAQPSSFEANLRTAEGRIEYVRASVGPVVENGQVSALVVSSMDLTEHRAAQQKLRENERLLAQLIRNFPSGSINVYDREYRYLYADGQGLAEVGLSREDLEGKRLDELFAREQVEFVTPYYERAFAGESVEFLFDFAGRTYRMHATPLADEAGGIYAIVVVARDDTRLVRENELNVLLADLARRLQQAETIEDMSQLALDAAIRATTSTYGYAGYIDDESGSLICPTLKGEIMEICNVEGKDVVFEHFAGLWGWVLDHGEPLLTNDVTSDPRSTGLPEGHVPITSFLSAPALHGDRVVGQVALANAGRDYTEHDLQAVDRIAHFYALSVRKKLAELSLERARASAEEASHAKNEFLANMSHEVRTPLNGVLGMLQLLQITHLDKEQAQYVETAIMSSRNLLTIINDILDFSKIEAGKVEIEREPFSLNEDVTWTVAQLFRDQARAKNIDLEFEVEPGLERLMLGDPARLRQILFNLVGNAVKFTQQGEVRVKGSLVPATANRQPHLLLTVSDTGIGIPEEKIESIFNSFTQVDSTDRRRYGGSGLGLAIVRRLVELMGGAVNLESEEGKGTTFYVEMPVDFADAPATDRRSDAGNAGPSRSLRILLAEDNPVNQLTMADLLRRCGHEVEAVDNGIEVLDAMAERPGYDMVVMDIQMPLMSGLEATRRIRGGDFGNSAPDVPILAVTAHTMKGDRERFLEAGLDAYLAKPISLEDLRSEVERLSSGRKPL